MCRGGRQMFLGRALPQGQSYLRSNNPNVPNESNGMGKLCVGHLGFGWRPGMGQQPAQLTHYRHAPHHFVNDFTPADVHVAEGRGEGDCHRSAGLWAYRSGRTPYIPAVPESAIPTQSPRSLGPAGPAPYTYPAPAAPW